MSGLFDGTPLERPVTCPQCGKSRKQCACPRGADGQLHQPKTQPVRVSRERRAGGKMITIIRGLGLREAELSAMLKNFKSTLGTGGTIREDSIELQGDHRDKLVETLRQMGYPAKPSGG